MTVVKPILGNIEVKNTNIQSNYSHFENVFQQQNKMEIDSFEYSNSQGSIQSETEINDKRKNTKNILLGVGIGLSIATMTLLIRNKNSAVNIERHFNKLYSNVPKSQATLKKVFMNENLSADEAVNILKRYEKIEMDSFNMSKKEYVEAIFREAKNNFNLKNDITLSFDKLKKRTAGQFISEDNKVILDINKFSDNYDIWTTIHHELRHAYQKEAIMEYPSNKLRYWLGVGSNIPPQKLEYCKKMCKGAKEYKSYYVDKRANWNNPLEQDAREAAYNMWALIVRRTARERFFNNISEIINNLKSAFL